MAKKKKRPLPTEGGPDASAADINKVLLGGSSLTKSAQQTTASKVTPGSGTQVKASINKAASASGSRAIAAANAASTKLALELIEAAKTRTVQRMGWLRDVRLRRAADAFMRNSSLHQQASAASEADGVGKAFEKPSHQKLEAFSEELRQHVEDLQAKLKVVPMNGRREINLKSAGPGKVIGEKLRQMKAREAELKKNPRAVIKGDKMDKRRRRVVKTAKKAAKSKALEEGDVQAASDEKGGDD
mmetsp:Transcript_17363/g.32657  ORF Transcript_17363/g.32657 Transcript_17363/m.32657 type:complete len:244 (-) Transcript_17363:116-847(-)